MVTMESDGYKHVLRMEDDDVYMFQRVPDGWEITFKRATLTTSHISVDEVQRDYIRRTDVNNRSLYRRTPELITQLQGWRDYCIEVRDSYLKGTRLSVSTIQQAARLQQEIQILTTIIDDLLAGEDLWEEE